MASFNQVNLMGNLTRDPELRYTTKGTAICKITLACNRVWIADGGEKKEEVAFIDVTLWGRMGETCSKYKRKGEALLISGYLRQESWDDKQTGQKRSKLSVVASEMIFVGGKRDGGDSENEHTGGGAYRGRPARSTDQPGEGAPSAQSEPPPEEDDVPF